MKEEKTTELKDNELNAVTGGTEETFNPFSQNADDSPDLGKSKDNPFVLKDVTDLETLADILNNTDS